MPENVLIDAADTDTSPHCMGTFASRATHRVERRDPGSAGAKRVLLEVAADEVAPEDLETDGQLRPRENRRTARSA